jgi:hypothetical protein
MPKRMAETTAAQTAPQKKTSEKLVGKWSFDAEKMIEKMDSMAKTDKQKADLERAKPAMQAMKIDLEFTSEGKMSLNSAAGEFAENKEGTYTVKREEAAAVVVTGTMDGETKDATVKFLDDNSIEVSMEGEDELMIFKRAN